MRSSIRKLIFCGLLSAPFAAQAQSSELLPVEYFAKLPMVGGPSSNTNIALSPDGARYAAIISLGGEPALAAIPTDGSDGVKFTRYGDYQPRWFRWANDRYLLISFAFTARRYGTQTLETRLAVFDVDTGKLDILVRHKEPSPKDPPLYFPQFQDRVVSRLPVKGDEVLVALDRDNPGVPGVYKFPLSGGSTGTRIMRDLAGVQHWEQDAKGVIRLGYGLRRASSGYLKPEARLVFRQSDEEDFKTHATFDPRDLEGDAFGVAGFTEEPNIILITDTNEQGRVAVYRFDITTAKIVGTVFSHEKYDVGAVQFAPGTDRLVGVSYLADEPGHVFFDEAEREDHEALGRVFPGRKGMVVSRSLDGTKLIARTGNVSTPTEYHYFDMGKNVYANLGSAFPQLAGMTLSETRPITYKARDGLDIDGYLTLPKGAEAKNLPMIVHPHGGPASRDSMRYDYWVQYFVSRGWAVLQMNFRGSTGYGEAFEKSGEHEWGKAMQDDVSDGVLWAVAEGIADPARVCVGGASYGGYVALQGAVSTPELYRCVVSLNGVSDIQGMINDDRNYSNFMLTRDYLAQEDPKAVSPIHHADKVKAPILIAYSTKDLSVRYDQGTGMIGALKRAGKQVVELELKDGDHYLTHERHRLAFFQAMDSFLQEHLGLGVVPSSAVAEKPAK